jgi:hypothetical protein
MKRGVELVLPAVGIGIATTILLTLASYVVDKVGLPSLSNLLSWPNSLLQITAPCFPVATDGTGRTICEGTPLNLVAFMASFPLSIVAYSAIAYFILRRRARRGI